MAMAPVAVFGPEPVGPCRRAAFAYGSSQSCLSNSHRSLAELQPPATFHSIAWEVAAHDADSDRSPQHTAASWDK